MSWRIPPDVNSGGTLRNVPPLLSHRSLYAVSFDGYGAPMCYDNSIIHIGALFQKGVCDLAEKRKDRNGRVLKTGENQRKNGTYEWPMPLRWGSQPC